MESVPASLCCKVTACFSNTLTSRTCRLGLGVAYLMVKPRRVSRSERMAPSGLRDNHAEGAAYRDHFVRGIRHRSPELMPNLNSYMTR